jgi:hypothetical protein
MLLALASALTAVAAEPLAALVNPALPLKAMTRDGAAAILRGDILFLNGKRLVLILPKPSSPSLPAVTFGLLKENPQAFLMRIKGAKLRGLNLDPQFVDTAEGVVAAVAANSAGIGFLAAKDAKGPGVRIIPIPE